MNKLILAAAVATFAVPAAAAPGNTSEADGVAKAQIISPITIEHDVDAALNFGIIVPALDAASDVEVTGVGTTSVTGEALVIDATDVNVDHFTVSGDPDRGFDITTTDDVVTNAASDTMDFTTSYNAGDSLTLGTDGTLDVYVAGTLTVGANQAPGTYSGSYTATVAYN